MSLPTLASWFGCGIAHELFHVIAAVAVGKGSDALTLANLKSAVKSRYVVIPGSSMSQGKFIRHSGWAASVVLALVLHKSSEHVAGGAGVATGAAIVAFEAICSDLLCLDLVGASQNLRDAFHCGNFGLVLLDNANKKYVIDILRKMVEVTMMYVFPRASLPLL